VDLDGRGVRVCGLRFERAQGYFVGAIYINYAMTVALAIVGSSFSGASRVSSTRGTRRPAARWSHVSLCSSRYSRASGSPSKWAIIPQS